jgi:hypothetical protein
MAGEEGTDPTIYRSFSIISPTGGVGTRHQRLLAALLDPSAAAARGAAELVQRREGAPRIVSWWEL